MTRILIYAIFLPLKDLLILENSFKGFSILTNLKAKEGIFMYDIRDKRRFPRIHADMPLAFQVRESKDNGHCLIQNISVGGIQIVTDQFLGVNKSILLEFSVAEYHRYIGSCVARVVWVSEIPYSDKYKIGLEFQDINENSRKSLNEFVMHSLGLSPS